MASTPRFELVPLDRLRAHESVDPEEVRRLAQSLRTAGVVQEPLLVADGSYVILNGHHRYHALRALRAQRAPAWVVDYQDPGIALERWGPGPPIEKSEVVAHAERGEPFPVKTTRHLVRFELPARPTPLAELGVPSAVTGRA